MWMAQTYLSSSKLIIQDLPLPNPHVRGRLRARVAEDIDALPAVECDGQEVLIEEGLEHDNLIALLQECYEDGVLSYGARE